MTPGPKASTVTGRVDDKEAEAALIEVAIRLRAAREAIAGLMRMENARTPDLHADDEYIRKVIRSVETKRRNMLRNVDKGNSDDRRTSKEKP